MSWFCGRKLVVLTNSVSDRLPFFHFGTLDIHRLSSWFLVGVVVLLRSGVDLPEQSVSSALLPVIIGSNHIFTLIDVREDQVAIQSGQDEETNTDGRSFKKIDYDEL